MAAGVQPAPANNKKATMSQNIYMIVESVADRFKISPFEIMDKYLDDVITIWTGAIISAKNNENSGQERAVRVTSKTATWY